MDFQVIKACRIYFHAILAQPVEVRGVQSLASSVKRPSDACLLAFLHLYQCHSKVQDRERNSEEDQLASFLLQLAWERAGPDAEALASALRGEGRASLREHEAKMQKYLVPPPSSQTLWDPSQKWFCRTPLSHRGWGGGEPLQRGLLWCKQWPQAGPGKCIRSGLRNLWTQIRIVLLSKGEKLFNYIK